jgi:hypothetical protein
MLARWKAFLARVPAMALHCAAIQARHPLERWLALAEEERQRKR